MFSHVILSADLCFPPVDMPNGYYTPIYNLYRQNDTVTFFCEPGYTLVGTSERVCDGFDFGAEAFPECYSE